MRALALGSLLAPLCVQRAPAPRCGARRVHTVAEFDELLAQGVPLSDLDVRGDTAMPDGRSFADHEVGKLLLARKARGYTPGLRDDGQHLSLAIEGGGMRGCVGAGAVSALMDLELVDCFDSVYGASAGALVGAGLVSRQEGMPRIGCSIYYDMLTGRGRFFLDKPMLPRTVGLGLLSLPWCGVRELLTDPLGRPVLNLRYLLDEVLSISSRQLDWASFNASETRLPLHVVASGLESRGPRVLSRAAGHFSTREELLECLRASMLLPGIAGPPVTLPGVDEPLNDAQLFEPIPFKSAVAGGASHVLVVRTRPDGIKVSRTQGPFEINMYRRFFKRKTSFPQVYDFLKGGKHKEAYCRDILALNEYTARGVRRPGSWLGDGGEVGEPVGKPSAPHVFSLALPAGSPTTGQLERRRSEIFAGVRRGFAAAFDVIEGGRRGADAARRVFPDEILDHPSDPALPEPWPDEQPVHLNGCDRRRSCKVI